jgi:nicotinamide-nucleotide amidase
MERWKMLNNEVLEQLAEQVGYALQQQGWYLATAESCTGGWVSQTLTAISGSSNWFERGFITYSNLAKQEMLGVDAEILAYHGAVSEQVVCAMAKGALMHSHAHVALAISGIAGPTGGSQHRPVGTVWLAWALPEGVVAECYRFSGNRADVRFAAAQTALQGLFDRVVAGKLIV